MCQQSSVTEIAKDIIPKAQRQYDIVLFGATGFTGKICAAYLAKNYSEKKLKWAIAGRNQEKLNQIKKLCEKQNAQCKDLEILIVNQDNDQELIGIVKNTKVILSAAGPYFLIGTKLVAQCVAYGTDYCDLTGEIGWTRQMIEKYDELAVQSGARIVNCCGCDSTPWDIAVYSTVQYLKQKDPNKKVARIDCLDEMCFMFSGGTLATFINSIENKDKKSKIGYDPLDKLPGIKQKSTNKFINKVQSLMLSYNSKIHKFMEFFPGAFGNYCVIRRSNVLLNYGTKISYYEGMKSANVLSGFNSMVYYFVTGLCVFNPFLRKIVIGLFLPRQGEGPSEKILNRGYLDLQVIVQDTDGDKYVGNLKFVDDPAYREAGRMVVESGLCFVFNSGELKSKGGFHTTASCFGDVLLKRLQNSGLGCEFSVEQDQNKRESQIKKIK